jgi:hypothetical protein
MTHDAIVEVSPASLLAVWVALDTLRADVFLAELSVAEVSTQISSAITASDAPSLRCPRALSLFRARLAR